MCACGCVQPRLTPVQHGSFLLPGCEHIFVTAVDGCEHEAAPMLVTPYELPAQTPPPQVIVGVIRVCIHLCPVLCGPELHNQSPSVACPRHPSDSLLQPCNTVYPGPCMEMRCFLTPYQCLMPTLLVQRVLELPYFAPYSDQAVPSTTRAQPKSPQARKAIITLRAQAAPITVCTVLLGTVNTTLQASSGHACQHGLHRPGFLAYARPNEVAYLI
jgi:hypothetical protein